MSRVVILKDVSAAPDHNHVRLYKKGEVHEVGSSLMPQGLADALTQQYIPTKSEGIISVADQTPVEAFAKLEEKPVSEEVKSANAEKHKQLFGTDLVMDW